MRRRTFVGVLAASGVSLAGCFGGGAPGSGEDTPNAGGTAGDGSSGGEDGTDTTDTETGENRTKTLRNHPAAAKIDSEPRIGPAVGDADGVIIEFADPSCPSCARFEQRTYPKIKSQLVETGRVAFVYREYPNVYPWGEAASQALEGTFAQEASAFWGLKSYYYANSDAFTEDNVLGKTETHLNENTNVDGRAVVNGVENGEFEAMVQQDVDTANDAGVGGTPAFFLFRSGSFVTKITGPQAYSVFKNSLGY